MAKAKTGLFELTAEQSFRQFRVVVVLCRTRVGVLSIYRVSEVAWFGLMPHGESGCSGCANHDFFVESVSSDSWVFEFHLIDVRVEFDTLTIN